MQFGISAALIFGYLASLIFDPKIEEIVKRMSKKCKILLFSSVDNVMVKIVSLLRGFEGGNL